MFALVDESVVRVLGTIVLLNRVSCVDCCGKLISGSMLEFRWLLCVVMQWKGGRTKLQNKYVLRNE